MASTSAIEPASVAAAALDGPKDWPDVAKMVDEDIWLWAWPQRGQTKELSGFVDEDCEKTTLMGLVLVHFQVKEVLPASVEIESLK